METKGLERDALLMLKEAKVAGLIDDWRWARTDRTLLAIYTSWSADRQNLALLIFDEAEGWHTGFKFHATQAGALEALLGRLRGKEEDESVF